MKCVKLSIFNFSRSFFEDGLEDLEDLEDIRNLENLEIFRDWEHMEPLNNVHSAQSFDQVSDNAENLNSLSLNTVPEAVQNLGNQASFVSSNGTSDYQTVPPPSFEPLRRSDLVPENLNQGSENLVGDLTPWKLNLSPSQSEGSVYEKMDSGTENSKRGLEIQERGWENGENAELRSVNSEIEPRNMEEPELQIRLAKLLRDYMLGQVSTTTGAPDLLSDPETYTPYNPKPEQFVPTPVPEPLNPSLTTEPVQARSGKNQTLIK